MEKENLIGRVFERLTVLSDAGRNEHRQSLWVCRCLCGQTKIVQGGPLKSGKIKSCGCLRAEQNRTARLQHGESFKTKEYVAWRNMKGRCLDKKNKNYKDYGARGIKVCDKWMNSFPDFLKDMGRAPSTKHSVDRKENEGNYTPENCRWATALQQANNKRNNKIKNY